MTSNPDSIVRPTDLSGTHADVQGHTAGPWRICGAPGCTCRMIWSGDRESVVAVAHGGHWQESIGDPWPNDDSADANALLIAAAPDLLAALRGLTKAEFTDDLKPYWTAAHAAIAKATGGQQS